MILQIRQTDLTYKEARKLLKKDSRYELADPLSKHDKEEIYDEHLDALSAKKKQLYRELLDESSVRFSVSTRLPCPNFVSFLRLRWMLHGKMFVVRSRRIRGTPNFHLAIR